MHVASPTVTKWIEDGHRDPEAFWERAARAVPWFRTWDRVYEDDPPTFRWFVGAETNIAYNALDHHVAEGNGDRDALIYFNERGDRAVFTYAQLLDEVSRVAAALRGLGVGKGDRVTLSMPTCPEAVILMLACMRIGAIHSVVFAGFGAQALGDRISASGSRVVFTADITYRKGKEVPLKPIVDDALQVGGAEVQYVVVLQRSAGGRYFKATATFRGTAFSPVPKDSRATGSRWRRTNPPSSSRLRERPPSPSWPFTITAAIRCRWSRWGGGALGSRPPMSGGRRPISVGSSGTATWCTVHC